MLEGSVALELHQLLVGALGERINEYPNVKEAQLRIEEMERHFFGQKMSGKITPDQVRGIDFYIYDKKAGSFRLEIDNIRAISTDGRNLARS